jgi:hypothetical protein
VSTRRAQCAACGQVRRAYARAQSGVLCPSCYHATLHCERCGRVGVGRRSLCWACLLADRVDELRARAGPDRGPRLAAYLDALQASANPHSTLRWMQMPAFALVEDVVEGRLRLSHRAFDEYQGTQGEGCAIAYLRAALVAHGALPTRDETAAAFERWLARTLPTLCDGPDRATVTAFATWQVARRLTATTARHNGTPPPSAVKHARNQIRQAIALTTWLEQQNLSLADLRQDLLDQWLAAGSTTRRAVSGFIDWLCRTQPTARRLVIAWPVAARSPPIATDQQRLSALAALLENRRVDPAIRFTAAAVLLFGQPLTRISALCRSDVIQTSSGWQLRFGQRPVQAPALLDGLLHELTTASGPRHARVAASPSDWLLPGRKHGAHASAEDLRRQLKILGLPVRPGRRGALLALAAELPAPVLSEHFAIHRSRAAQWTRAAGRTYADYVATRTITGPR